MNKHFKIPARSPKELTSAKELIKLFSKLIGEEFTITGKTRTDGSNPDSEVIEGVIIAPGERLGELFSYVSEQSYKCQRSIPMLFFEKYRYQVVFNPD